MAAFVFNRALGKIAYYATLPAANDAVIWVLLQSAGLEADSVLRDHTSLSGLLAASNNEATFTGYARLTHTSSISVTIDDTADDVSIDDSTDPAWSPTSAQSLGKIVAVYDPDTTGGTDADLQLLFADDFVVTTVNGQAILYLVASGGFCVAS